MNKSSGQPFGQIAIDLGYASPEQIESALREQRSRADRNERIRIGMLLNEMGVLATSELFHVLSRRHAEIELPNEDAIRLAANLRNLEGLEERHVLLVTSALAREGKSEIARQLATVLALMGQEPVLLIDANLRHPDQHRHFQQASSPGLAEILAGRHSTGEVVKKTDVPNLSLLTAGEGLEDIAYHLLDDDYSTTIDTLRERYSRIIIDSSAIMAYPDTGLMAPYCDGVLLVVAAGERKKSEVIEAKHILDGMNTPILGTLLSQPA